MARVTIDIIRHGEAMPAADESHYADIERPLSKKGREQARARRTMLGNPYYDKFFGTATRRTCTTAAIIANVNLVEVSEIPEISIDTGSARGKALNAMFKELRYQPLKFWHAHEQGINIVEHGQDGMAAIEDAAGIRGERDSHVLVCAHAVYMNSYGFQALQKHGDWSPETLASLLETAFGESEGFRLVYEDGVVTSLTMLQ